jgi:TP901 family phage tail tape measure protein
VSEFLAEARILVRPDTSRFRAELEAQLAKATKPITIPVVPVVAGGISAATAATNQFTVAQAGAAAETQAVAAALEKEAIAANRATAAQTAHVRSVNQGTRGAAASALSLFGLRGATLAASGAFLAGTAAVVGFSKAVQSAAALETELNVFRVSAGATADEMIRVSAAATQLGRDITLPGVTASTAATAMTELAKAGLSVQDALDGARGTLQLATAAQIDVKDATELVAGALNSFQLEGADAVKVADLLTGAAKESQGEITDMGTSLAQASAVSRQFGVSIEDTVTLLTQLAQAGISGGRAGTSLRVAFLRLVNPPAEAAKALKELNVQIRDVDGNLRPQVFTDITTAMEGYSKAQRDATLATIFGSDAIRAAGIIGADGAANFLTLRDAVTEAGLAQESAAARTSGLQGSSENLSNQVGALGLEIGNIAKGPLKVFVDALAAQVGVMTDSVGAVVTITGEIKKFGDQLVTTIPYIDDFKQALNGAFGSNESGGGAGESIKKGLLGGLNLLPSVLIAISNQFDDASVNAAEFDKEVLSITDSFDRLAGAAAGAKAAMEPANSGLGVKQIENIIVGFDAKETRARIAKDNANLLAILNDEQAFLERQLTRDYVKRRPALQRAIEQALLGTVNDIEAVQSQAQSKAAEVQRKAKQAADTAAAAARGREQDLLSQFGVSRDQQENRIAAAEATKGLGDDIKAQQALKALVLRQIAAVKERISVAGGQKAAIVALQAILIQVNTALKSLNDQQRQAAEERRQAVLQSIGLDVEFAQITDDQAAEVRARNKKLTVLEKALAEEARLHGKNTVAYKEIRNQIAQETAAINEIRKEKQKENNAAGQANFEFLQAQQGFASSLLGNLIPRGATGGLVGGGAPVQAALQPQAGVAEGKSRSGVTSGQAQTTNAILLGILGQLKELNGGQKAPEAAKQFAAQQSTFDGVGPG